MSEILDTPINAPIYISILAAVLPAIFWLVYIYKKDKLEKEPVPLLLKLILGGILSTVVAFILEMASTSIDEVIFTVFRNNFIIAITLSAMIIGIIEEISKYIFLKKIAWNNHDFNYTFDGLVYAIFVSLGFALAENILYVFNYGLSVAFSRAILTIPAHMAFGAFMGADFGIAKIYDAMGEEGISKSYRRRGVIIAILLHGIYDALAMSSSSVLYMTLFFVFVVVMDVMVFVLIKRRSDNDKSIREIIEQSFYTDEAINLNGSDDENSVK